MQIALCDDSEYFLVCFKKKLEAGYRDQGVDVAVEVFGKGTDLLASGMSYDFVYLDIEMPSVDGFQVASILCAEKKAGIIFVSALDNMAYGAFEYHPFWFLRKSRVDAELAKVIGGTIKTYRQKVKTIAFYTKEGGMDVVNLDDILYFEVHNHTVTACTENGRRIQVASPLRKYEDLLKSDGFVRVHISHWRSLCCSRDSLLPGMI